MVSVRETIIGITTQNLKKNYAAEGGGVFAYGFWFYSEVYCIEPRDKFILKKSPKPSPPFIMVTHEETYLFATNT